MSFTEGILVTGGFGTETSVEVILSDNTICTMPPLPAGRDRHSQSGLTACGGRGSDVSQTCSTFSNGDWITSHTLREERQWHVSWNSPSGIMLLGGLRSRHTTELSSTSSSAHFDLPYDTMYVIRGSY